MKKRHREMRRKRQLLSDTSARAILTAGSHGILALEGDYDYPYAVPMSYVLDEDCIYFHSATEGHKMDSIARNPKASFCVVEKDEILPEKFTTLFRSVIAFGKIKQAKDKNHIIHALRLLADKYSPGIDTTKEIGRNFSHTAVFFMEIEYLTGKESIELVAEREKNSNLPKEE